MKFQPRRGVISGGQIFNAKARSRKEFPALRPLRLRVLALILSLTMPLLTELWIF
jgi:hypothetical protein